MTTPNPFTTAGSAGSLVKIADLENCLCIFRPRAVEMFPTKDYGPKRATVCAVHVIYSPGSLPDPANPAVPRQASAENPINYPELLIFNGPIQGQFRAHLKVDGASLIPGWIIKGAPLKAGQQPPWILNGELSAEAQTLASQWHATFGATLPALPPIPTPQPLPAQAPAGYAPTPPAGYAYPPQQPAPGGYAPAPTPAGPYGYPQQQPAPGPQYAPAPAPQPQYAAPAPQYTPVAQPAAVPQPQYAAPAPQYAPAGPTAPVPPPAGAPAPQQFAAPAGVPAPPF